MLFRIAWRNLTANRKRSIVTILLSLVSTALIVIYAAMLDGMYGKMIDDAVQTYNGYIQVTGEGYRETPSYEKLVYDVTATEEAVSKVPGVVSYTERFETYALFATDAASVGGMLTGVVPEKEPDHSWIKKSLTEGEWLGSGPANGVCLGKELARKLEVGIGGTVSMVSSAVDYSFTADNLQVACIFSTGLTDFDATSAFLSKAYMDRLFLTDNIASAIVITPEGGRNSDTTVAALETALKGQPVEVLGWQTLIEDVLLSIEVDRAFGVLTVAIFYGIIFFVIMIYAMIAIFARTREFGIMRAVGTTPMQAAGVLFWEAAVLGLSGAFLGGAIGGGVALFWQHNPIYLSGYEEMAAQYAEMGFKFDPVLYTTFSFWSIALGVGIVFLMNLFSVLYPAWKVTRLKPVEAINYV